MKEKVGNQGRRDQLKRILADPGRSQPQVQDSPDLQAQEVPITLEEEQTSLAFAHSSRR